MWLLNAASPLQFFYLEEVEDPETQACQRHRELTYKNPRPYIPSEPSKYYNDEYYDEEYEMREVNPNKTTS